MTTHQDAKREVSHGALDAQAWRQEWANRFAPRCLSADQCHYCERYLDKPGNGWFRVSEPSPGTIWVEAWKGFFYPCHVCNPDAIAPEPSKQYNCLHCNRMKHDFGSYLPEPISCYVCELLEQFVVGIGAPECGAEHWQPILAVPPASD